MHPQHSGPTGSFKWRAPAETPNGIELSCRASRVGFRIGCFSAAGPVSCSELLGGQENRASDGYDQEREMLAPAIMILAVRGK